MDIHVSLRPSLPHAQHFDAAIVVDVLRATTCAATYLEYGAAALWLCRSVEQAQSLAGQGRLLAGERAGLKVAGFDFGNSPLDISQQVAGQIMVMTTSNGTKAAYLAQQHAQAVALGCLRNARACAQWAMQHAQGGKLWILCAGTDGQVSLDDMTTAGVLIRHIGQLCPATKLTDAAQVAHMVASQASPLLLLQQSEHGRRLERLGFEADVEFCAIEGVSEVVPQWQGVEEGALVFKR